MPLKRSERPRTRLTSRTMPACCSSPASPCRSDSRRLHLLPGMVAGSYERSGLDVTESHSHADLVKLPEFRGRVVAVERDVIVGWTQVLTEREDIHVNVTEVAHHSDDF